MNMLSLRVSSIKGSENLKKNSDIRHECATLPIKYALENGMKRQKYEFFGVCLIEFYNLFKFKVSKSNTLKNSKHQIQSKIKSN